MAGYFSDDPYFPPEGNGGEPMSDSDDDPVEDQSMHDTDSDPSEDSSDDGGPYEEVPIVDPIIEEDPEEDPDEDDPIEDQPDVAAEPVEAAAGVGVEPGQAPVEGDLGQMMDEILEDLEQIEGFDESEDEGESEPESEVDDPRYPVRSRTEPLPPPSFKVYQTPGGRPWKHTPRKRVPPIRRQDVFTFTLPVQGQVIRSDGAGTSAAGAAAGAAAARAHSDAQRQMVDMGYDIQGACARVRRLEADMDVQGETIARLQAELVAAQTQISSLEEQVVEATQLAQQALAEGRAFRVRLSRFYHIP